MMECYGNVGFTTFLLQCEPVLYYQLYPMKFSNEIPFFSHISPLKASAVSPATLRTIPSWRSSH